MNLISLSLYGMRDLYVRGALANARLARIIYPGWTIRVYCAPDVPVMDGLRELGADVCVVNEGADHKGLFWRFLPAAEVDFDYVVIRDADSRLNVRERAAVETWMASGRPFHVMRDHSSHRHAYMLAGMWGCRGGSIPDIAERIARVPRADKHDDTTFLRNEIWPLVREDCLVHSSVPDPLGGDAFPEHSPYPGFVGEIVQPRIESEAVLAVLIPSRGRPEAALATAGSAFASAFDSRHLRIVVGVEPDEAAAYRAAFAERAVWIHVLNHGGHYVRAIRELHGATAASIYGLAADDFVFETPGWDDRVRQTVADLPNRLGIVFGDDGLQGERLATAPFLTSEWIAAVGDVLPGDYEHLFCDTEVDAIARRAGLLHFLPDVKITHRHHLVGEAAVDATYERSARTWERGQAEFEQRWEARENIAGRLAQRTGQGRPVEARLPSTTERLLLAAACHRDNSAVRAFAEWTGAGAHRSDPAHVRLFPLVWWNLCRLGADGAALDPMRTRYQESWATTQRQLDEAAAGAATLERAGIPAMLVGGLALAAGYYEAPQLRPTSSIHVMVPADSEAEARGLLEASRLFLRVNAYARGGWFSLESDERLWSRARVVHVREASIRVLSTADEMLRVCTGGMRQSGRPAAHWVADALAILRTAGEHLDWSLFIDEAERRRVAAPVARALEYLHVEFGESALRPVYARLERRPEGFFA